MIKCIESESDKEITQFWIDRCLRLESENYELEAELAALKQKIAEAKPVAWMYVDRKRWKQSCFDGPHDLYENTPLYTLEGIKE